MNKHYLIFVTVLCVLIYRGNTSRILGVFPFPSISHQIVFRPLTQELARRGHEVTVLTPDVAFPEGQTPANLTEIDLHDITYGIWTRMIKTAMKPDGDAKKAMQTFSYLMNEISSTQFKSDKIQRLLKRQKEFDLVITEAVVEPALIFSHIYKAPVIQISSFGALPMHNEAMGVPLHPFLYPTSLSRRVYNHTTGEKFKEFRDLIQSVWYMNTEYIEREDAMFREIFGSDVPSGAVLRNSVDMMFLNAHPVWIGNVPMPPNIISIWGIHKNSKKQLPEDIKSYLDSSKHGVIYMSFGTNTIPSALPEDKIRAFVKVFSELPYDVLWKFDKDEVPGQTKNIKVGKWFPQSDLLRHPKIKLFITQGGLQSTEEAIDAGVPLVGVPILGDQWYNVAKYQHFQIGEKLDIATLTEDDVRNAVKTVLENDRYRENIVKLRNIMRDEPESALERAVWWTEYVLRHKGAKHLRAAGANLSWTEYYEVKLVSIVVSSIIFVIVAVLFCIRTVLNIIISPRSKVKKN